MELKFKGHRGRKDCTVLVSHDGGESYANLPCILNGLIIARLVLSGVTMVADLPNWHMLFCTTILPPWRG